MKMCAAMRMSAALVVTENASSVYNATVTDAGLCKPGTKDDGAISTACLQP
jgi:hypothetical protein